MIEKNWIKELYNIEKWNKYSQGDEDFRASGRQDWVEI